MRSLKAIAVKPVHSMALTTKLSTYLSHRIPVRRIIMLHGVGPNELEVDAFTEQMTWLAHNFSVVSLSDLITSVAADSAPSNELALTFDDGLRCHAEVAAPILKRLNLPATFFVCPALIEERRWLWNHEARERLRSMTGAQRQDLADAANAPDSHIESIVEWMKTLPTPNRRDLEAKIRARTATFLPSEAQRLRYDPVTWEELHALDTDLFTVGSHTSNHPILTTLDEKSLERELVDSRAILEQRLGKPVDLFCYPNGSQDQRVRDMTAKVYRAAVSTENGFVRNDDDIYRLPRIPVADSAALLAWRMHRPKA